MISFEMPEKIQQTVTLMTMVAENMMRPVAAPLRRPRARDPWDYINFMHDANQPDGRRAASSPAPRSPSEGNGDEPKKEGPRLGYQRLAYSAEMLSWGDAGLYLCSPVGLLGAAAVAGHRHARAEAALPHALRRRQAGLRRHGHHRAARRLGHAGHSAPPPCATTTSGSSTARRSSSPAATRRWSTRRASSWCGRRSIRRPAGPGIEPFVVEAGTPGCTSPSWSTSSASAPATRPRSSCRTAASPSTTSWAARRSRRRPTEGFKGAMATFDASRPMVAASALGVARATLEAAQGVPRSGRASRSATACRAAA